MASKRRVRERECGRKRRWPSDGAARLAMARTPHDGSLHVYACRWCRFFHVGHVPGQIRAVATAKGRKV